MQRIWGVLCAMAGALALVLLSVGAAQAVSGDPPESAPHVVQDPGR